MVEGKSPLRTVDVALDLRRASVHVPGIVLWKRQGEPGSASARARPAGRGPPHGGPGQGRRRRLAGEGRAQLDPLRPERLSIARLRTPHGDLTGQVALERGVWRGRVDVGRLDVGPCSRPMGPRAAARAWKCPTSRSRSAAARFGDAPLGRLQRFRRTARRDLARRLRGHVEDSEVSLDLDTPKQRSA